MCRSVFMFMVFAGSIVHGDIAAEGKDLSFEFHTQLG
jgi:hypothetical protein